MLSGAPFAVVGTMSGGATAWDDLLVRDIPKGKRVVILPDEDEPGSAYADDVERSLQSAGIEYRRISFAGADCKDVSEYMKWYSIEDVVRLIGTDRVRMPEGRQLTDDSIVPLYCQQPDKMSTTATQ